MPPPGEMPPSPLDETPPPVGDPDRAKVTPYGGDAAEVQKPVLDPPPSSRWWPVLGMLQSANQLVLMAVAAWIVIWFVIRPQVPDVVLPIVGPVPAPPLKPT